MKKTTLYEEISEDFRQEYVEKLKEVAQKNIVYIDETGIDHCLYRKYAITPQKQKIVVKIGGRKFRRTNIVIDICQGKWVAPLEYMKVTDSILFEFQFENYLLKKAGTNSTIILDNTSSHKKSVLASLAEGYSCEVLFLPPYSPDLNPIEEKWAWLKRKLREVLHVFGSFDETIWDTS